MELILLGTSAAYPTVDRACSGFLVRNDATTILVDMGSGVTRNLMRWVDPHRLNAIIISHLHQDHFTDIYPLYYYLAFSKALNLPIDVYAPAGARDFIAKLLPRESRFDEVYRFVALDDRREFSIGSLTCKSFAVKHSIPAYGLRIEGERTVAYSSDTDFDGVLYEIAENSDAFICEATKQADYEDVLHLTAAQAGQIAARAGVRNLILTHIWPEFDPAVSRRMAADEYEGSIIVAEDNMCISLDEG
ncbi:MAG TPA: MBL fold metallo-hydrolase [Candidatus Aquicultor sp.]|jgi:ribonuclease BN (tRNA processing enzyme)